MRSLAIAFAKANPTWSETVKASHSKKDWGFEMEPNPTFAETVKAQHWIRLKKG